MNKLKTMIVYHAHCIDGITAATVVVKYLTEIQELATEDIVLYPMNYDDDMNRLHAVINAADVEQLYAVDFSFTKENLYNLYEQVDTIHLYDHHASAFRNLMGVDYPLSATSRENFYLHDEHNDPTNIHIVLDNAECGASLCWKWLMEAPDRFDDTMERNLPTLIKFVKDYDLWLFLNNHTKAINTFLKMQPKTVPEYTKLLKKFETENFVLYYADLGETLLSYESSIEDSLISSGVCPIVIEGISGLAVNAPYAFASNIGNKLALESKTFGAVWSQLADGKIAVSLRSNGDGCNVSKLAECMGGGGHKTAAGFSFMSPSYDVDTGITLWSKVEES